MEGVPTLVGAVPTWARGVPILAGWSTYLGHGGTHLGWEGIHLDWATPGCGQTETITFPHPGDAGSRNHLSGSCEKFHFRSRKLKNRWRFEDLHIGRSKGEPRMCPPLGPIVFQAWKCWPNNRLTPPPWGLVSPSGKSWIRHCSMIWSGVQNRGHWGENTPTFPDKNHEIKNFLCIRFTLYKLKC